jgi:hypothetical protein
MSERVEQLFNLVKEYKKTFDGLTPEEKEELDELIKKESEKE